MHSGHLQCNSDADRVFQSAGAILKSLPRKGIMICKSLLQRKQFNKVNLQHWGLKGGQRINSHKKTSLFSPLLYSKAPIYSVQPFIQDSQQASQTLIN